METITCREEVMNFLKLIEKRPCIYNTSLASHADRRATTEAWKEIATKMDATVRDCKEKWRKLRISYSRSLKMQSTPYYLLDNIKFLNPFLKILNEDRLMNKAQSTSAEPRQTISKTSDGDLSLKFEIGEDEDDSSDIMNYDIEEVSLPSNQPLLEVYTPLSNAEQNTQGSKKSIPHKRRRSNSASPGNDPRQMFLLSLLPDINAMTDEEMRTFRRQIVMCIDNIFSAREN